MRILITIFKNGDLRIFYIHKNIKDSDILNFCATMFHKDFTLSDVNKYLVTTVEQLPAIEYHSCIDIVNNQVILKRDKVIQVKTNNIRNIRNNFFTKLDLDYKIAQQKKNIELQNYIEKNTQWMRDLPQKLNFDSFSVDDIIKYNPFNNILKVKMINNGSGYNALPRINFNQRNDNGMIGTIAQASCVIQDGKIMEINMTDFGSNYASNDVYITPPNNGEQATAEAIIDNI